MVNNFSIDYYLIDIIHKTKAITFKKFTNHTKYNVNKSMFQVILVFSDWIFDKSNHSFLHPFRIGGNRFSKNSTWSYDCGTGAWVKIHRFNFNAFSRNANTINWKIFPTHGGTYKLEKIQRAFWREVKP